MNEQLDLIIAAQNKSQQQLKQVRQDIESVHKNLEKGIDVTKRHSKQNQNFQKSFDNVQNQVKAAAAAFVAYQAILRPVLGLISRTIDESVKMGSGLLATNKIIEVSARNYGIGADKLGVYREQLIQLV